MEREAIRADHLVAGLTAPQREKLAAIQTDPRARALLLQREGRDRGRARPRIRDVVAHARRDGDDVTVWSKGLALQLTKNQRLHHQEEARIRAHERATITRALAEVTAPPGPWDVVVTRQGPRLLDEVNATTSIKGVEDAVAAWLGVDDGDRAQFRCRAVQTRTKGFGVVITINGRASW